jgi:hypothetical protein
MRISPVLSVSGQAIINVVNIDGTYTCTALAQDTTYNSREISNLSATFSPITNTAGYFLINTNNAWIAFSAE